ncbi:hypothetical protein MKX03_011041 [Papaver bracteatum]|nr:hypothetical protein MKX03_011041 [Papaver bracteatum]
MSFEDRPDVDLSTGLFTIRDHWVGGIGIMDGKTRTNNKTKASSVGMMDGQQQKIHLNHRRTLSGSSATSQGNRVNNIIRTNKNVPNNSNSRIPIRASYFSVESLLVLVMLTASLLILPVILPPLPPPPFLLLLLPIGILILLMILAFTPSDARDISSSYV